MATKRYKVKRLKATGPPVEVVLSDASAQKLRADGYDVYLRPAQYERIDPKAYRL